MTEKKLRALAKAMQEHAGEKVLNGCFTDIWLDDIVVSLHAGKWAVTVRADDLMELCAAVLKETK
jgi:hypothetical protein